MTEERTLFFALFFFFVGFSVAVYGVFSAPDVLDVDS